MAAVKAVLRAIPGLDLVELDVPVMSTQASHLSVLPQFKEELRQREFAAAAAAGVTTIASIFHACHRDLIAYQPQVTFELLNFMELIGEAMGIHIPDLYKKLRLMGDIESLFIFATGRPASIQNFFSRLDGRARERLDYLFRRSPPRAFSHAVHRLPWHRALEKLGKLGPQRDVMINSGHLSRETLVTLSFADIGDKTELTLRQAVFATVAARDDHRGGWSGCLERFAEYLATHSR
jgi:hypothetical protein